MSKEWEHLRPFNRSQESAFEELCAQLVSNEKFPTGSIFIRNGLPDGGIECYWTLPDGTEHGWQVKFFTNLTDSSRWSQINKSAIDALKNHPNLVNYTTCLAMDLPNAITPGKTSARVKYEGYVKKWRQLAEKKGRYVNFVFWGDHEIWKRLTSEENRGRNYYWFHKDFFSNEWFKKKIDVSIANVGVRYSPKYNVDLPINKIFNGFGRTDDFFQEISPLFTNIQTSFDNLDFQRITDITQSSTTSLEPQISIIFRIHENLLENRFDKIDLDLITNSCSEATEKISEWMNVISDKKSVARNEFTKQNQDRDKLYLHLQQFEDPYNNLLKLRQELATLGDFSSRDDSRSINVPTLIITGNAGNGKTHLFCDIALNRINKGLPTILLLGSHFNNSEPWGQIIKQLELNCLLEEFLGSLNTIAEVSNSKCLILIDALNEGEGKKIWRKYFAGMIETISHYPRIGLAVSIRNSYKNTVIPEGFDQKKYVEVVHEGFSGHEFEATKVFFEYYHIERPTIPILNPEFKNPLFLKTFCEAIHNHGETKIPKGIQGISDVFTYYINSIDKKLSEEDYLDFDRKQNVVSNVLKRLSMEMAKEGRPWLLYDDAKKLTDEILPGRTQSRSLLHNLLSEGTLSEDIVWIDAKKYKDIIRFPYERFSDFLITDSLFLLHLGSKPIDDLFKDGGPLYQIIENEKTSWQNQGLIEAFSIYLPDRYGKELIDVAPHCANFESVRQAFINSLIWRQNTAFSESTTDYINSHIIKRKKQTNQDLLYQLIDAFLLVSSSSNHPFNADRLHKWLKKMKLPARDALWTIYLHNRYSDETLIHSLIDWAWFSDVKEFTDDESRRLYGITLVWFMTSSNRYIRDRATKALVSIFSNHIDIFTKVLIDFKDVNDPYVLERLFAVAYGCAMRSNDSKNLASLATETFNWIFKDGKPPRDILLRDYARGTIECALQKNNDLDIDIKKIRPPYCSVWEDQVPSSKVLNDFEAEVKKADEGKRATKEIYNSIMGFEDFARYIIGTNFDRFDWSLKRLKNSRSSVFGQYKEFINSLNDEKKILWKRFQFYFNAKNQSTISTKDGGLRIFLKNKYSYKTISKYEMLFLNSLTLKEQKTYTTYVVPYLLEPHKYKREQKKFNLKIAQLWILKRVFDLGWSEDRFGEFDDWMIFLNNRKYIRAANKPERIGKKYQWIAYHEFLGIVSDNFSFNADEWDMQSASKYDGPWQTYLRDIDPSFLLEKTESSRGGYEDYDHNWWFKEKYENSCENETDEQWITKDTDLPDVGALLEVTDPKDNSKWINLCCSVSWNQKCIAESIVKTDQKKKRHLFYVVHGYLMKKQDSEKVFKWAQKQNFIGRWMPDPWDFYHIFHGEFVWSPAYKSTTSNGYSNWTIEAQQNQKIPGAIHNPCIRYHWSSGEYDCSIEDGISISIPSALIIEKMGLSWNGNEGKWYNKKGELVAFDPSIEASGPQCLLINKKIFSSFLVENGYEFFWALLGEKNIITGIPLSSCLYITGAYRFHKNEVIGTKKTTYHVFERASPLK